MANRNPIWMVLRDRCSLPIKWSDGEVDKFGIHIPQEINEHTTIHFNIKLEKIDKILLPWKGFYLQNTHSDNFLK